MMSMASLTRSSAVKSESSILACRHEEEPRLPQSKFLDGFLESRILLQLLGQALLAPPSSSSSSSSLTVTWSNLGQMEML